MGNSVIKLDRPFVIALQMDSIASDKPIESIREYQKVLTEFVESADFKDAVEFATGVLKFTSFCLSILTQEMTPKLILR